MRVVLIWGRRSTALRAAPVIVGILAFAVISNAGWVYDWFFASRRPLSFLPLVAVVVAGCVAHDTARAWDPVGRSLGSSLIRWRAGYALIPLVATGVAGLCFGVVWIFMTVACVAQGAVGRPDPWVMPEMFCALMAAAGLGLLFGARIHTVAAGPLAAASTYVAYMLSGPYGFPTLMGSVGASDSMLGLTRAVPRSFVSMGVNGALAATAALACIGPLSRVARRCGVVLAATLCLTIGLGAGRAVPPAEFVATTRQSCIDGATTVCGPVGTDQLLRIVAGHARWAERQLADSELTLPTRLLLSRESRPSLPSEAIVPFGAQQIVRLDRATMMESILSRPRLCPQLFAYTPETQSLLEAEGRVRQWLVGALRSPSGKAPPQVLAAYRSIQECKPS